MLGAACLEPFILAADLSHFEPFMFLRSFARLGSPMLVPDSVTSGSPLPIQALAMVGGGVYMLQANMQTLSVSGVAHIDPSSSARGPARLGALLSASASTKLGLLMFLRGFSCTESSLSIPRSFRLGLLMPVADHVTLGLSSPLRSFAQLDSSPSALRWVETDPAPSLRSMARLDLMAFILGHVHSDLFTFALDWAQFDFLASPHGPA